jgi:hypothetical protein
VLTVITGVSGSEKYAYQEDITGYAEKLENIGEKQDSFTLYQDQIKH